MNNINSLVAGRILDLGATWHYRLDDRIHLTNNAELWQATWLEKNEKIVIKTLPSKYFSHFQTAKLNANNKENDEAFLMKKISQHLVLEMNTLENLNHPNILKLRHNGQDQDDVMVLVMEQMHCDLEQFAKLHRGQGLAPSIALDICYQLHNGLKYLHSTAGLRHLDIKPKNILCRLVGQTDLGSRNNLLVVKIADFGTIQNTSSSTEDDLHIFKGTPGWLPPEQIIPWQQNTVQAPWLKYEKFQFKTSASTDFYALGLILFWLLTGSKTNFANVGQTQILQARQGMMNWEFLSKPFNQGLSGEDIKRLHSVLEKYPSHINEIRQCLKIWLRLSSLPL